MSKSTWKKGAEPALKAGDCCFAHVKGHPWWPAIIVKKIDQGKKRNFVSFYGADEAAWLPDQELRGVSEETIQEYKTPASLRRKHFKEGFKEMMDECQKIKKNPAKVRTSKVFQDISNTLELPKKQSTSTSKVKIGQSNQNGMSEYLCKLNVVLEQSESPDIDIVVKIEPDDLDGSVDSILDLLGNRSLDAKVQSCSTCEDCGKLFSSRAHLEMHSCSADLEDLEAEEPGIHFGNNVDISKKKTKSKQNSSKPVAVKVCKGPSKLKAVNGGKKKKRGGNNVVKTLREEELDNQKAFKEHVEVKDGIFHCRICKKFSSLTELLAKSHVVSCGKRRKRGRPLKISTCLECGQEFTSITDLKIHHKRKHICESYTCSVCLKNIKHRPSYIRHIQSHKFLPTLECSVSGCGKTFKYRCNFKRHLLTHSRSKIMEEKAAAIKTKTREFEVELEEKVKGGHHSGQYKVKEMKEHGRKRNFSTFDSTLGLNEEDWKVFVNLSSNFNLPVSERDFEASISINEYGEETTTIVWNEIPCGERDLPLIEENEAFISEENGAKISSVSNNGDSQESNNLEHCNETEDAVLTGKQHLAVEVAEAVSHESDEAKAVHEAKMMTEYIDVVGGR